MRLIILFFIFFYSFLVAKECTSQNIKNSDQLYEQANIEENKQQQIELLQKALTACYAPEIEASLFVLKAEISDDVYRQIDYYTEVLGLVAEFGNVTKGKYFKNECNKKLAVLYEPIDEETANDYRRRIVKTSDEHTKKVKESENYKYIFTLILFIVLLWTIYPLIKQKLKN